METKELPKLGFGPVQLETFAPLIPIIEEFAIEHQLILSRVFDGYDHFHPHCCYFVSWSRERCHSCFIRICSKELFAVGTDFQIGANGRTLEQFWKWDYSSGEGQTRLSQILNEAFLLIESSAG